MIQVPLLRAGRPYRSLAVQTVRDFRTEEPIAAISQANPGLIARDLAAAGASRRTLAGLTSAELLAICARAADLFAEGRLPVDPDGSDGDLQGPEDYIRQLSATCGLPESLCRFNMGKIRTVLAEMASVLAGLTRGLDLDALDAGWESRTAGGSPSSPRPIPSALSSPATRRASIRYGCRPTP